MLFPVIRWVVAVSVQISELKDSARLCLPFNRFIAGHLANAFKPGDEMHAQIHCLFRTVPRGLDVLVEHHFQRLDFEGFIKERLKVGDAVIKPVQIVDDTGCASLSPRDVTLGLITAFPMRA